jgi:hypothetical protein
MPVPAYPLPLTRSRLTRSHLPAPAYPLPLTRSRLPAPAYPFPLRRLKRDTHERSLRRKRRARFPSEWQPQPSLPRSSCLADLVLLRRGLSSAVADGNVLVQRLSLDLIVSTLPCDGAALTHAEKARLSCHRSHGLPAAASRCIHSQAARHCVGCMDGCARTRHAGGWRCLLRAHRGHSGDAVMAQPHDKGMERHLSIPLCGILHAGAAAARRAAAAHKAGGVALTTYLQLVARHVRRDRYSPSTPSSSVVSPGTPARPSRATPPTSAPGLGSPRPHLRRGWACPGPYLHCKQAQTGHICTGTGLTLPTSAPGLGSPLPRLHRDWAHPRPHLHRDWADPRPHLH